MIFFTMNPNLKKKCGRLGGAEESDFFTMNPN